MLQFVKGRKLPQGEPASRPACAQPWLHLWRSSPRSGRLGDLANVSCAELLLELGSPAFMTKVMALSILGWSCM